MKSRFFWIQVKKVAKFSSSAFQLEALALDPWEEASTESHRLTGKGHEVSFIRVAQAAKSATNQCRPWQLGEDRRQAQAASLREEEARKSVSEQLMHASGRQDAERAEKSRWLGHLATLLVGAQTPLGQRLVPKPAACNSTGLGLRSGTLRNRVNALRRYFSWLAHVPSSPVPVSKGAYA